MAMNQVSIYSDNSSIEVVDILTGATLTSIKTSNSVGSNCLSILGNDFLVYAESESPIIHFKPLKSSQTDRPVKIICPGKISALVTTIDAAFCIVAIAEKCYVWHVSTGNLVAILSKHCRPISVIALSKDGTSFVTAGKDGFVLLWELSAVIRTSVSNAQELAPKHSWSNHQAAITDVIFGSLDTKIASCSLDKTCKIYDTSSGDQLAVVHYPTPIHKISMDALCYFIFAGGSDGVIYETKLHERDGKSGEILSRKSRDSVPMFIGHRDEVSCLATSVDGLALLSSSRDSKLKLWNIVAKHCVRTIATKGPVTNLFCATTCHGFLPQPSLGSKVSISSTFKRYSVPNEPSSTEEWIESLELPDGKKKKKIGDQEEFNDRMMKRRSTGSSVEGNEENLMREEVKKLKRINEGLFHYSVDELFKNISKITE